MPHYSQRSKDRLLTCDHRIQAVFNTVIMVFDNTIICGHRSRLEQTQAFESGNSKLPWPQSKHNHMPSYAVDAIPYPIDCDDRERMSFFAGHVLQAAKDKGIRLRWGGDWDMDTEVDDNRFDDLVHFELVLDY